MIAEVIFKHTLSIGTIIGCTIGLLIGLGLFTGTTVLIKQKKIKPIAIAVFYILSFAIIFLSIFSLIKT